MLGIYLPVCLVIVDTIYPLCIRTGICAHQVDLALMGTQRSHIRNITFMFSLQSDITVFFVDGKMGSDSFKVPQLETGEGCQTWTLSPQGQCRKFPLIPFSKTRALPHMCHIVGAWRVFMMEWVKEGLGQKETWIQNLVSIS